MANSEQVVSMAAIDELIRVRLLHESLWSALRATHGAKFEVWATTAEMTQRELYGDPNVSVPAQVNHYGQLIRLAREAFSPSNHAEESINDSLSPTLPSTSIPSESTPSEPILPALTQSTVVPSAPVLLPTVEDLAKALLPLFIFMQDRSGQSISTSTPFPDWSLDALTIFAFRPTAGVPENIAQPLRSYLQRLPEFQEDKVFQSDVTQEVHTDLHRQFLVGWSRRPSLASGSTGPRMSL